MEILLNVESKNNLNFRIIFICSTVWKSHCIKMSHSLCLDLLICPANVQFFVHTLHPYSWTVVPDHLNTAIQSNSLLWSNQLKIQIFTGVLSGERSINFRLGADAVVFKRLTRVPHPSCVLNLIFDEFQVLLQLLFNTIQSFFSSNHDQLNKTF